MNFFKSTFDINFINLHNKVGSDTKPLSKYHNQGIRTRINQIVDENVSMRKRTELSSTITKIDGNKNEARGVRQIMDRFKS